MIQYAAVVPWWISGKVNQKLYRALPLELSYGQATFLNFRLALLRAQKAAAC